MYGSNLPSPSLHHAALYVASAPIRIPKPNLYSISPRSGRSPGHHSKHQMWISSPAQTWDVGWVPICRANIAGADLFLQRPRLKKKTLKKMKTSKKPSCSYNIPPFLFPKKPSHQKPTHHSSLLDPWGARGQQKLGHSSGVPCPILGFFQLQGTLFGDCCPVTGV